MLFCKFCCIPFECVDFNECVNISYHNCSEAENKMCQNINGSFTCECMKGFQMNATAKTCEGERD